MTRGFGGKHASFLSLNKATHRPPKPLLLVLVPLAALIFLAGWLLTFTEKPKRKVTTITGEKTRG